MAGAKSKSVISLLSRNPRPGTVIPLPASCSMVLVYETTLPHLSTATRWLVLVPSLGCAAAVCVEPQPP